MSSTAEARPAAPSLRERLLNNPWLGWAKPPYRLMRRLVRGVISPIRSAFRLCWARLRLTLGIQPLSYQWGGDRGVPPYYYYILQFLEEFRSDVRGHCVEFQEDSYSTRFGGAAVTKLDILHVDHSNPRATLVGDLTKPNDIPSDQFDCIICTHVLHIIYELDKAVADLHRILKPGGVLLVAVPLVSMDGPEWNDLWRFTANGLAQVLARSFGEANVTVRAYGNSLTAAGQLRGLTAEEFTRRELDTHDSRFAVEVCARAVKAE